MVLEPACSHETEYFSPGDAVLLVSRDAQVAWPLACSQDKLRPRVERLLSSFVCCLSANTSEFKQEAGGRK